MTVTLSSFLAWIMSGAILWGNGQDLNRNNTNSSLVNNKKITTIIHFDWCKGCFMLAVAMANIMN